MRGYASKFRFDATDCEVSQYLLLQSKENNWNNNKLRKYLYIQIVKTVVPSFRTLLFSSFFASYDAMNEYCGDRNVYRKLSTVDGNDT